MSIFDYIDYKKWVRDHIHSMGRLGRGQFTKIAHHLNVSPTIITQVFTGTREISPEQAILLAEYLMLSKFEKKFLILLVNYARAGSEKYRQELLEEIKLLKNQSTQLTHRLETNAELSEEALSVLYSSWYYIAIWSLIAIDGFQEAEAISQRLQLSKRKTRDALDFLIKNSIIVVDEQQKFKVGPTLVHLPASSPQFPRNSQNWRLKAFSKYDNPGKEDLCYTSVVTLSENDVVKIRENLLQYISRTTDIVKESPSERLYCFCLDWFEV